MFATMRPSPSTSMSSSVSASASTVGQSPPAVKRRCRSDSRSPEVASSVDDIRTPNDATYFPDATSMSASPILEYDRGAQPAHHFPVRSRDTLDQPLADSARGVRRDAQRIGTELGEAS